MSALKNKTQSELIEEIESLKKQVRDFERIEEERKQTEENLKKQREFSEKIINTSNAIIVGLNKDHILQLFNEGAEKITGYKSTDVLGKDWFKIFFPPEIFDEMDKVWKYAWGTTAHSYINPIRTKNGDERMISWQTTGIYEGEDEKNHMLISIGEDISKRKKTEEALTESEKRFHQVAENAQEWIWEANTIGLYTYASPVVEKILGYKPEEIVGIKHFYDFFYPEDREEIKKEAFKVFAQKQFFREFVNRNMHKNGKTVWLSTSGVPMLDEKGNLLGYRGADTNITERIQAEEALKESEERYRNVVENAGELIWQLDTKGNFVFFNKYAEQVSGQKSVDWQGKHYAPFVHPDDLPRVNKIAENTLAGNIIEYETRIFNIKGEIVDLEIQAMPIYVEGEVIGTLNFGRDITGRKKAEKKLRESHNQLRGLARRLQMIREEERATIAREIHDDLGQSLTALKIDITWMKKNPGMAEEEKSAKIDVMLDLTNSTIKTVKRIATELRPGILDDLGLIPAIEWQAEEFRKRSDIQCNLQISFDEVIIEEDISITVFRIFQESLTNIARHSGATKIEVVINRKNDLLQMELTDNGVGISEEQISSSRSLGLIGMNERASVLKGKLTISRATEGGTSVKVYIPLKRTRQSD